jgi:hypothetical protein
MDGPALRSVWHFRDAVRAILRDLWIYVCPKNDDLSRDVRIVDNVP